MSRPLKIGLVSTRCCTAIGGQEAYIRFLGDTLAREHQVFGASRYKERQAPSFEFYESAGPKEVARPGWSIRYLQTRPAAIPVLRRLLSLYTRPALQGTALAILDWAYGDTLRENLPADLDVIHYTGAGWDAISHAALHVARQRRCVFAVTPFLHPGTWGDSPLDMRFYNSVDVVFVCSEYEKKVMVEQGVDPKRISITGLAPASNFQGDAQRFRQKHGLGDRPLVLFIGRKQAYKGYHALCTAITKAAERLPEICLVAVGPDIEPPFPAVPAHNLLDLGPLSVSDSDQQEKADALAAADVFCMPSQAEAFGIVYVEAWANRCPVIAGGAPAVRELVQNGVNGFRVEDQSPEAIADHLVQLIEDRELHRRLGEAGYALVQERYTWEAIVRHHVAAYRAAGAPSA